MQLLKKTGLIDFFNLQFDVMVINWKIECKLVKGQAAKSARAAHD